MFNSIFSLILLVGNAGALQDGLNALARGFHQDLQLQKASTGACIVTSNTVNSTSGMGCTNGGPCVLSTIRLICDAEAPSATSQEFRGAYSNAEHLELHRRVITTGAGTMVGLGKKIVNCQNPPNEGEFNNLTTDCLLQQD